MKKAALMLSIKSNSSRQPSEFVLVIEGLFRFKNCHRDTETQRKRKREIA
jgi:hypothetical protein